MSKETIVVFDFDGTITKKDTFLEVIAFYKGYAYLILLLLGYSPFIFLGKLGLCSLSKIKERIFSRVFSGVSEEVFNRLCEDYFEANFNNLVRKSALVCIKENLKAGRKCFIVTASSWHLVSRFAQRVGIDANNVLATSLEVKNGILSGRFASMNCKGKEKVKRLTECVPALIHDRESVNLIAYGDSSGDRELLEFSDEPFYRYFKQ